MDALQTLQATWLRDIPAAAAMGIEVLGRDGGELRIGARLAANINVHGTAFAGSLYSICALAGWGAIWLELERRELYGAIVLSKAEIDYLKPVEEDIVATSRIPAEEFEPHAAALLGARRTKLSVDSKVSTQRGEAVRFRGVYAVHRS